MGRTRFIDLTGQTFGRLKVISLIGIDKNRTKWDCVCICGNHTEVLTGNLRRKSRPTLSCGCYRAEQVSKKVKKHGMRSHRIYYIWCNMMARCYNKKDKRYHIYGGAGVEVYKPWHEFINFYNDTISGYSNELTLDRYPNKFGHYEPSNFRWATQLQQQRNRTNNVLIEVDGKKATAQEWAEISGTISSTIKTRISRKWSSKEAVFGKTKEYAN